MTGFPRGKPKLVVAGGTGQALSTAVLTLGDLGYDLTVIGRRPLGQLQRATLFARRNVRYEALDLFARQRQARVRELAASADIFVMGAEPHVIDNAGRLEAALRGVTRVYSTLHSAGYTTKDNEARRRSGTWPKRVVRIGSSPAEIPYDGRLPRGAFLEDTVSLDDLQQRAAAIGRRCRLAGGGQHRGQRNARHALRDVGERQQLLDLRAKAGTARAGAAET